MPATSQKDLFDESTMSFGEHLEELRKLARDCLSHLPDEIFAARESLDEYLFFLGEELLDRCGADEDTREVLEVLQYALKDLQRGVENPLLTTEKKVRAKPHPMQHRNRSRHRR